jgi:hypothetical protein
VCITSFDWVNRLADFAPLFSKRVWQHIPVLIAGAILAPGKRTITSVLRIMGQEDEPHFQNYHRVLNRAVWSSRQASRILLNRLVAAFAPSGPLILGLDDTIERRWGAKIKARGIYRDPVRSSRSHVVKASGLRWLSLMLLVPIPWAKRVWALPFLTALSPSERYHQARKTRHKKLTDWGRQLLFQVRRWLPRRDLIVVMDSSFAALDFLARLIRLPRPIHAITRLRLDAALYEPAPGRDPRHKGRPRRKGARLPTLAQRLTDPDSVWQTVTLPDWYGQGERMLEILHGTAVWYHSGLPTVPIRWILVRDPSGQLDPQGFLCTRLEADPVQVLRWFVLRWSVEVTFQETRAHLGMETQRQWSDLAIARTTPALLALYSLVTWLAHCLLDQAHLPVRTAAWYAKPQPTFVDTIALVRRHLWASPHFSMSAENRDSVKIPQALYQRLTDAICYAA